MWLGGPGAIDREPEGNSGTGSPPPLADGQPSYHRGASFPPESPTSTLHSVHHQHSPTRARSPSIFRDSSAIPITAPAGTTKFFTQQDPGISASSSSFAPPQGGQPRVPHRRVSSQSFSTLYQNQQQYRAKEQEREGSVGPSSRRSSSILLQRHHPHHRPGQEAGEEREKEGMGKVWIRWMHKRGIKTWTVPLLVLVSTLIKFCVGLGSYSGT